MSVIYILWLRELRRYVRSRAQIVASLGQPLMYLIALGFGLGPVFQKAGEGSYLQFVAPGVVAMTVLFSSVFSGMGLLWDRQFGFLKETLVAPVPRISIMLGRTLGAATVAVIQGLLVMVVCFIAGFRVASVANASAGASVHGADCLRIFGARHGDRLGAREYAGLSAHHELPRDADLLSFRSAVPAYQSADSFQHCCQSRSSRLWSRRAPGGSDRRFAFRAGNRCGCAGCRCVHFARGRQPLVLTNSGLKQGHHKTGKGCSAARGDGEGVVDAFWRPFAITNGKPRMIRRLHTVR